MYHDLECCSVNIGVDNLLSKYKSEKEQIINLVINDPNELINIIWTHDGPLAKDNECRCKMSGLRTPFSCSQCKNINRLKDNRKDTITIKYGCCANKTLMILNTPVLNPYLNWDNVASDKVRSYVVQYQNSLLCGTNINANTLSISGDQFTIRALIMWMVESIFTKRDMPHYLTLYTVFICGGQGYSLCDAPTIGTFADLQKLHVKNTCSPFKCQISRTIIHQLVAALNELSTISFSHGNPSVEALVFGKEHVSYKYDGFNITGDLTLKIVDFWNSSVILNNVNYFSKNAGSSISVERNTFIPDIDVNNFDGVAMYRLSKDNISIYMSMKHIGVPLYTNSFDLYLFFTSLMCNESFYMSVTQDVKLYELWTLMWLPEEFFQLDELIKEQHIIKQNNFQTTINIIHGFWLRCDIVKFMWSLIKS